jgi:antitoxin MazE
MMNLQIAKWGNSLAVRIPADYVRQIGVKQDLASVNQALPMGASVMEQLRSEARY